MAKALIAQSKFDESLKWLKRAILLINDKEKNKTNKKLSFWWAKFCSCSKNKNAFASKFQEM